MKIIFLLLLLAAPCHAATKNTRNLRTGINEKVWKQLEGTWIRKDFIHELYDRHSLYDVLLRSVLNNGEGPVGCEPAIAYRLTPFYFETLK